MAEHSHKVLAAESRDEVGDLLPEPPELGGFIETFHGTPRATC